MNGDSEATAQPITSFRGLVAVITGGATGIGLAIALELAKEDARIVIASTNKHRLEEAAGEIKKAGCRSVLTVPCDVSLRDSVNQLHNTVMEKYGQCDLLFCNAGVTTAGPYLDHRPEVFNPMLTKHVLSCST